MDKQELVSEPDHYLITKMCHAAAEGLELQCSWEYWSKTEEGHRVTAIHRLRPKERANLPTENLEAERNLLKSGIIASWVCKD